MTIRTHLQQTQVFIVHDRPAFATALTMLIDTTPDLRVVGQIDDVSQLKEVYAVEPPTIVLVTAHMKALRDAIRLSTQSIVQPLILYYLEWPVAQQYDGVYLNRPASPDNLFKAIRALHQFALEKME